MASLRLAAPAAIFMCCCIWACSSKTENSRNSASTQAAGDTGGNGGMVGVGAGNATRSKSHVQGEAGGAVGQGAVDAGAGSNAGMSDQSAGAAGDGSAGADSLGDAGQKPAPCDLNGNCTSKCENSMVTCGVEWPGFACELEGFTGATAQVSCGQRVVIGTACCGGCGCVPVELFFDGVQCWEGMPQCTLPQFTEQLFNPHLPTTPNPSFTVPSTVAGSFYLGSGGLGGAGGATGGSAAALVTGGAGSATSGAGGASGDAGEGGH